MLQLQYWGSGMVGLKKKIDTLWKLSNEAVLWVILMETNIRIFEDIAEL